MNKHQFTQSQLLAILCLLRYEEWTFREAEVRLKGHGELRQVLGLKSVPDFTTVHRFLRREGVRVEPITKLLFGCRGCSCAIRAEE